MSIIIGLMTLFFLLFIQRQVELYTTAKLTRLGYPKLRFVTAFIGVPAHEISHAIACLIFGHKINEIKLLQFNGTPTLGYVNHSYSKRNVYHRIGNLFIGLAPIYIGLILCVLFTQLLFSEIDFTSFNRPIYNELLEVTRFIDIVGLFISNLFSSVDLHVILFTESNVKYVIWLFVMSSIITHIIPSSSDFEGVKDGLIFLILLVSLLLFAFGISVISSVLLPVILNLVSVFLSFYVVIILTSIILICTAKLLSSIF
uniref:Uncharacterized protein n=1 Tax=Aliivibrio wodanis TaxID=80852 RepID=A0A5Q4ZUX2_9GAMM|nr:hypothetical protein AW0309160_03221 [Aliivibrio wodanis]